MAQTYSKLQFDFRQDITKVLFENRKGNQINCNAVLDCFEKEKKEHFFHNENNGQSWR